MKDQVAVLLVGLLCAPFSWGQSAAPPWSPPSPSPAGLSGQPAGAPPAENLTAFDYRTAGLKWQDGRWQLQAGGVLLKDFGRRQAEAWEALRVIRELQLTQHGTVGTPQPVMEYWLSHGQAPRGGVPGLRTVPFDAATLGVEQREGQWYLGDERQVLFAFGGHEDEARQALAIIRQHGFNQVGYVGQGVPVMIYFLAGQTGFPFSPASSSQMPSPTTLVSRQTAEAPAGGQVVGAAVRNQFAQQASAQAVPPVGQQLAPPAPRQPQEEAAGVERVPFDWRQVRLERNNQSWELVCAGCVLIDFGPRELEARQALTLLQEYHFTEQYRVGRPIPSLTFFLANAQSPRGLHLGTQSIAFRPELLTVRPSGDEFLITDGAHALLHVSEERDARSILQVIQHNRFDHLCRIGVTPSGGMMFFMRADY